MPVSINFPLDNLMKTLDEYTRITKNRIFYEYIMIDSVNDSLENAHELANLLK